MKMHRLKPTLKSLIPNLLFLLLTLSSCSKQKQEPLGKHLVIAMSHDLADLDPRNAYLSRDASLAKALYEGLTRETDQGIALALAESYTLSKDHKVYTFKLRPSVWSDGTPLTAYDFEKSIKQLYFEEFSPSIHTLLGVIKNSSAIHNAQKSLETLGIHAKDDLTLVITLEQPFPYFLTLIARPVFSPVHHTLRESYKKGTPPSTYISNGPFVLKKHEHQNYLILEKNPHYYDHESVKLDRVTLKIIPDASTATKLFKSKSIDWIGSPWSAPISNEDQKVLSQEKILTYSVSSTTLLIYNLQKPLIQNKALRKAIAHAIDRKSILRLVPSGQEAVTLVPPNLSQLNLQKEISTEERQKKARAYFQEAKETLSEKELAELSILYPIDSSNSSIIAQEIQRQLKDTLGLKIKIQGMEYHCFLKKRRQGDFFIATGGWIAEYVSPVAFLSILGNPRDLTQWRNSDYEKTLEKLYLPHAYKENLKRAEMIIEEETPIIPLYHGKYIYAIHPKIQNTFGSLLGHTDLKNIDILS
ncbi:oligopeptide ABC transporter, periplasmic oligopeptide-binding protein OppA [Chlamydia pneumoniae LPCoLN]|uniref:peptide ABC transporter substrate-binding protein n=1 Tax=Chlamydia pneumoniae TaxID=83558 RepID=UPI0001BD9D29|nr:peptide ABC transporter substrate-binding protein [Chlamydia pneumoniae]ACZ33173.1 oligopeptide ABC transporter, periplasmic oligopeptide-binding protein OppA [Chlamydia pneumoniae LPCoLN]ETR80086.1 Oligopeptide ABC transporter, periplasmic oligopeptide-binding protein OppA [Chlamydia pneumoniae B21]